MNAQRTKRFWQWHSACAIYTGGFLALILITGAAAVFADPLYRWEQQDLSSLRDEVPFNPAIIPRVLTLANESLTTAGNKPYLLGIHLPATDHDTLRLAFYNRTKISNPFKTDQPWLMRSLFFHPQSGELLGAAQDDHSIAIYLRNLHVRLFAGTPGRNFVGLFGLALVFLSISGLLILTKFLGKKALWLIRRDTARSTHSDLHKLIGFVLVAPALIFALTGFWLGMQGRFMKWFSIERPEAYHREAVLTPSQDIKHHVDFAAVLDRAAEVYPELIPQVIVPSIDGSRSINVRGRTDGMVYERLSQGVILDKSDLSVLKLNNTHQGPWTEKLFFLQEGLHFGDFGGMPVRWLYFVIGMLLGVLPITGYAIQRLRTRRSLRPFWAWLTFGSLYAFITLLLVKTQGIVINSAYNTICLWLFVIALIVWWIISATRERRRRIT